MEDRCSVALEAAESLTTNLANFLANGESNGSVDTSNLD